MAFGFDWGSMWVNSENQSVAKGIGSRGIPWGQGLEDLDIGLGTREQDWPGFHSHLILCTRINLKWINDLKVGPETIKLEGNVGKKLCDISLGNDFFWI